MNKQAKLFISIVTIVGFLSIVIIGCEEDNVDRRDENDEVPDGIVMDIDGNSYETVRIGDQVWMAENLKTTKYNDSTDIPNIIDDDKWDDTDKGAFARYNNTEDDQSCGLLYNAYTIETHKLCPDGWHVPSDEEWKELEMELGMNRTNADKVGIKRGIDEGSKLAGDESLWYPGELINESVFGESGFKGYPGGIRVKSGGFYSLGFNGCWWSSTVTSSGDVWIRKLRYSSTRVYRNNYHKGYGFSVRCVKDEAK